MNFTGTEAGNPVGEIQRNQLPPLGLIARKEAYPQELEEVAALVGMVGDSEGSKEEIEYTGEGYTSFPQSSNHLSRFLMACGVTSYFRATLSETFLQNIAEAE